MPINDVIDFPRHFPSSKLWHTECRPDPAVGSILPEFDLDGGLPLSRAAEDWESVIQLVEGGHGKDNFNDGRQAEIFAAPRGTSRVEQYFKTARLQVRFRCPVRREVRGRLRCRLNGAGRRSRAGRLQSCEGVYPALVGRDPFRAGGLAHETYGRCGRRKHPHERDCLRRCKPRFRQGQPRLVGV